MKSVNGIIKTEAFYAKLGKSKVKECGMPREEVLSQGTSFISYYNEARPKKRLGNLSPAAFQERNPDGDMADGSPREHAGLTAEMTLGESVNALGPVARRVLPEMGPNQRASVSDSFS